MFNSFMGNSFKKLIMLFSFLLLFMIPLASAVCVVNFDKSNYIAGETATATMSCSSANEKSTSYVLTWRDSTTSTIVQTDTGTTPATPNTVFNEEYIIPTSWINGNVLSATLTGSQLEGQDSAIVNTAFDITTTIENPLINTITSINDSFLFTCNTTNTGGGTLTNVSLQIKYDGGSILSNSSGNLLLNETGNYYCDDLIEGESCFKTWNITGNIKSQNDLICYAENEVNDESESITINVIGNLTEDLTLDLNALSYSTGESVTAEMTSYFTNQPYNVVFYNSTGSIICNESGITSSSSQTPFFKSCVLSNISNQENNSVVYYINENPVYNRTEYFDVGNISSLQYSIQNILIKYNEAFLGFSQSIKGTVVDSNGDFAIGQCCRIQIDDAITNAPIFTSEDEYIDGLGSCETHWILSKDVFEAPKSYSAMVIAWECSDNTKDPSTRKRGYGLTSFDVNEYFTEENLLLPVDEDEYFAGYDDLILEHERTNNFGEPLEVLQTVWFSNIDTEQDYHYKELKEIYTTVNIGISQVYESYDIPYDLPTGTYRIEKNIFYLYQNEIKEFKFVKSESFNVTQTNDAVKIKTIYIKDYFDNEVTTSSSLITSPDLPSSNFTDPYYVLTEGFGYQICGTFNNTNDEDVYFYLKKLNLKNQYTGQSFNLFEDEKDVWKRVLQPGNSEICWQDYLPLNIKTHSDWVFQFDFFYGDKNNRFECNDYCGFGGQTDYFYVASINDMIPFDKWIIEPNATSMGQAGIYIVTDKDEYMSMNDDCEYKTQEEINWGETNVTCYDKNDNTSAMLTDYSKYLVAGEKFKVCFQTLNYFGDEINLEIYDFYLDDDFGESVVYFQDEESENYLPSITDDKVYLAEEPSRAFEQQGTLVDGYSNMCSKWISLPPDIKGGNNWDIQGKVRINADIFNLGKDLVWYWESDEFPIFGLRNDRTTYISSNTLTNADSYKIGDELYVCANVSSDYPKQLDLNIHYNYRCSQSVNDSETDRNVYGEYTEIRGISALGTQNQCTKFKIPDDEYFKTQEQVYCYASTVVEIPPINEKITTSSDYFNISIHQSTINFTPLEVTNFYIDRDYFANISIENPFDYLNKNLRGFYEIKIQTDSGVIYRSLDELDFHANESVKIFTTDIPISENIFYTGNINVFDLGVGWIPNMKDEFLKILNEGDQTIGIIINFHINGITFSEHFHNYTFKKSGFTHETVINSGSSDGQNHSNVLYVQDDGTLDFYVYFNLTSVSNIDGTYSQANRQTWLQIVNSDSDSGVYCYSDRPYSYLNNETGWQEYWLKHTCNQEDTQALLGKTIRVYRKGQFTQSPYVYDEILIKKAVEIHDMTTHKSNYTGGEVIYITINSTGYEERTRIIEAKLYTDFGLQIHDWEISNTNFYNIKVGDNLDTSVLLLPVRPELSPFDGSNYTLEISLENPYYPSDIYSGIERITTDFQILPYNAVNSENITSGTINNTNPVVIDYNLNIPVKSMDYFPNLNQPFRIKYHFISQNGSGKAITQFEDINGQYQPLEVYTQFPSGTTQNFSVILQPTLPIGNYSLVQEIEVDPKGVWEGVHKGTVGSITVTEDLEGEAKGLIVAMQNNGVNILENNVLLTEINLTTHEILGLLSQIDSILIDINNTLNSLDSNFSADLSVVNNNLSTINDNLISLSVVLEDFYNFDKESVFLVTDSIVRTKNAIDSSNEETIKKEMKSVDENLRKLKEMLNPIDEETTQKLKFIKNTGYVFWGLILTFVLVSLFLGKYIKNHIKNKKVNNEKNL